MNKTEAHEINKKSIIDALRGVQGVNSVVVGYSGGGDSGQVDAINAVNDEGDRIELPETKIRFIDIRWSWMMDKGVSYDLREDEKSLGDAIESLFWHVLGELHDGWENNDGGQGEFTINVTDGTFSLHHEQNYVEHFTSDDVV